jgi:hypothetical protein
VPKVSIVRFVDIIDIDNYLQRCRKAKYCGKECQSKAWSMGHRYWCSAREGGEPGQVPPDNMDQDNDDGNNNNNNAVTISVDHNNNPNAGNNGGEWLPAN